MFFLLTLLTGLNATPREAYAYCDAAGECTAVLAYESTSLSAEDCATTVAYTDPAAKEATTVLSCSADGRRLVLDRGTLEIGGAL
jgi:hypothetical protein